MEEFYTQEECFEICTLPKMKIKNLFITFLLFTVSVNLFSQSFVWDLDFSLRFDNREYAKLEYPKSQTLFGASVTPQVGLSWSDHHSVMTGFYYCKDFGTSLKDYSANIYLYYSYKGDKFRANAGLFPKKSIIGEYSTLFFSDSVKFYDHDLDGLLLQYKGEKGYAEVVMDWMGKFSETKRERFMIFGTGRYFFADLYAGLDFSLYHYANSERDIGVVDNNIANIYLGYKRPDMWVFDHFEIRAGWIVTYQRDRLKTKSVDTPNGFQFDFNIEKMRLGVYNSLYLGDNLMPYYNSSDSSGNTYNTSLYYGDRFYGTDSGVYNRTEFYWKPNISKKMDFKISFLLHHNGKKIGTQQLLTLMIDL